MVDQVVQQAQPFEEEEVFVASQWRLMWWRFKKHKAASVSAVILGVLYLIFPSAEFLGIGDPAKVRTQFQYVRPQALRFFDDGKFSPHVNALRKFRDPYTHKVDYEIQPDDKLPVGFFVQGYKYKWLNVYETRRHLIGFSFPEYWNDPETKAMEEKEQNQGLAKALRKRPSLYLLGSDELGRDQYSRLLLSFRISLSIGLVGILLSTVAGIVIGGISGYYGGFADLAIQRVIEIFDAIPGLPLWIALSAAVPQGWGILQVYFALTIILSIFGWTGMARVVRGKFLALRVEDFVMAAQLAGANEARIMFRHMLPSFYSHIIATASFIIPSMILGEVALSFLGLGLRAPAVSFGVMLQQAQNPSVVALYPWLMFVAVPVIVVVLTFMFVGDGLRDAADPYGRR
jgi:peptide/nickel transport system permease protein